MNANATGAAKGASYVPLLGVLYAAAFLAVSEYITGEVIRVDGGLAM